MAMSACRFIHAFYEKERLNRTKDCLTASSDSVVGVFGVDNLTVQVR
jgi:hypothetical protein